MVAALAAGALPAGALPVVVVNPCQVRDFAPGNRDAGQDRRAGCGSPGSLRPCRPTSRAFSSRRRNPGPQLPGGPQAPGDDHAGSRRRTDSVPPPPWPSVPASRPTMAWLEQELDDLDKSLRQTLRQSPVWRERMTCCAASPGVGEQLSLTLLAYLPGKRTVWGGRARVRTAPVHRALVASRFNPVIRDFYQRLLAAGKPKKLTLTACMRKLLVILNSMLKHGSTWRDPSPKVAGHSS